MREMNEAPDAGTTIEEMSEEQATAFGDVGEWEIECEYCGLPVYYRPGICPSCGGTVAAMDQNASTSKGG